jgi:hypothetical protein
LNPTDRLRSDGRTPSHLMSPVARESESYDMAFELFMYVHLAGWVVGWVGR